MMAESQHNLTSRRHQSRNSLADVTGSQSIAFLCRELALNERQSLVYLMARQAFFVGSRHLIFLGRRI